MRFALPLLLLMLGACAPQTQLELQLSPLTLAEAAAAPVGLDYVAVTCADEARGLAPRLEVFVPLEGRVRQDFTSRLHEVLTNIESNSHYLHASYRDNLRDFRACAEDESRLRVTSLGLHPGVTEVPQLPYEIRAVRQVEHCPEVRLW